MISPTSAKVGRLFVVLPSYTRWGYSHQGTGVECGIRLLAYVCFILRDGAVCLARQSHDLEVGG